MRRKKGIGGALLRAALTLAIWAGAGYVLLCLGLYVFQERLIFFPERLPPDYEFVYDAPFEELALPVAGAALSALRFEAAAPQGVILYFHGNAGSLAGWGDVGEPLAAHGYDVVIVDYRGYGKSEGRINGEAVWLADAEAVYAYVVELYGEERVILYGRSIGSTAAAYLAAQHRPRLLILEAPFYSLGDLARRAMPPVFPLGLLLKYDLPVYRWLEEVECPVVIFHGTEDEVVPFDSSRRLLSHAHSEVTFIPVEGGRHNNLELFAAYQAGLANALEH